MAEIGGGMGIGKVGRQERDEVRGEGRGDEGRYREMGEVTLRHRDRDCEIKRLREKARTFANQY